MPGKYTHYGDYAPEFNTWLETAPLEQMEALDQLPAAEARALGALMDQSRPNPFPGVQRTDYPILSAPGVTAAVFSRGPDITPDSHGSQKRPLAMVYHGGGWMYGTHYTESGLINTLASLGFVVVSIDYRMAPEHPYPAAFDDSWAGLQWALSNADTLLKADASNVYVAGTSAGGNLAAAVAFRARDEGVSLRGQILISPVTCHYRHFESVKGHPELESYSSLENVAILSAKKMRNFWDAYCVDESSQVRASPLLADSLAGVAPAYVQVAGADVLRDEAIAYVEALKEAGVDAKMDIYPGLPHGFTIDQFGFEARKQTYEDLRSNVERMLQTSHARI